MNKTQDLTNQKFGKLTVIERDSSKPSGSGYPVYWLCQCECGNICSVRASSLRKGRAVCCGMACKKSIPIGSRFGRLIVIERTDLRTKTSNGGHTIYKCQCDCGNEIYVSSANLKRGNTQSCGCIHSLGEGKIQSLLSKANISFNKEYTFSDLRSCENQKGILRYDFFVNNSYLIEYDGEQHFMTEPQGSYFTEEKLQTIKENDDLKNKYAKEHNIPLIRIPYTRLNNLCLEDLLLETSTFIIK